MLRIHKGAGSGERERERTIVAGAGIRKTKQPQRKHKTATQQSKSKRSRRPCRLPLIYFFQGRISSDFPFQKSKCSFLTPHSLRHHQPGKVLPLHESTLTHHHHGLLHPLPTTNCPSQTNKIQRKETVKLIRGRSWRPCRRGRGGWSCR